VIHALDLGDEREVSSKVAHEDLRRLLAHLCGRATREEEDDLPQYEKPYKAKTQSQLEDDSEGMRLIMGVIVLQISWRTVKRTSTSSSNLVLQASYETILTITM